MGKRKLIIKSDQELDEMINKVRVEELPKIGDRKVPSNCKICRLGRYCSIINHTLICPWVAKKEEKLDGSALNIK